MAVVSGAGRNDPCPCGSGRKYKRCCLARADEVASRWHRLRRAEGAAVRAVLGHVHDRYGWDMLDAAWAEFLLWEERAPTPADEAEFESTFIPWFAFSWTPGLHDDETPLEWPPTAPALAYLEEHPERFDPFERRFVEAACASPYSFHAVTAVERGRSLTLRDVMTGRESTVLERQASQDVPPGVLLFTRVVALDGLAIMVGCAPVIIPPTCRLRLLDLRDDMAANGAVVEETLRDWEIELRETYLDIKDELYHPRLPRLHNTDGDPLLPTKVHFALACPPREAFERLRGLALDATAEELLADAEHDPSGELRAVRFPWLACGNRRHRSWTNTIRGTIAIDGASLVAEVNSERRAREIRKKVEKLLGGRAAFQDMVSEPLEQALEVASRDRGSKKRDEADDEFQQRPEVREALRQFMAQHWEHWLDEKVPALRFETPREAARTPQGRERLEALFEEFEWRGRQTEQPELRPDVAALRARLGL
jgi:hypothetical protein